MRAISKAIKFGTLSQMPWTGLLNGLSHGCLPRGEPRKASQCQNVPSIARVAAGAFGFLTLIHVLDGPER